MPSEYDFLLPYSRRLRRAGAMAMGVGAFLAGAGCMAAIIALPLRPHGGSESSGTIAAAQQPQQGAPGAPPAQSAPPKETYAPLIRGVVAVGTPVVLIREGFMAVQGAAADPKDGSLLFTERDPRSKGGYCTKQKRQDCP